MIGASVQTRRVSINTRDHADQLSHSQSTDPSPFLRAKNQGYVLLVGFSLLRALKTSQLKPRLRSLPDVLVPREERRRGRGSDGEIEMASGCCGSKKVGGGKSVKLRRCPTCAFAVRDLVINVFDRLFMSIGAS